MATPNDDSSIKIGELDWRDGLAPAARPPGPAIKVVGIGSFHKSLPHNSFGEVEPAAFADFVDIANGHQQNGDFDCVARGPVLQTPALLSNSQAPFDPLAMLPDQHGTPDAGDRPDRLVNPQAGRAIEGLGPDPSEMELIPAPGVRSLSTAAEMVELMWLALLRDVPLERLQDPANLSGPLQDLPCWFAAAVADVGDPGRLGLPLDLPRDPAGELRIDATTLFRLGLRDEEFGPLVSQFFLHDCAYGSQLIVQKQLPYKARRDFLTDHGSWLRAQNAAYDSYGHPYASANDPANDAAYLETDAATGKRVYRRIATLRDLARFVHKDTLHQAFFNAALLLLSWDARVDRGNPYGASSLRQRGFATLGAPHLLSLVSEVASRALKVVWRQKWLVHRRLRPEAYGGLMQMQEDGFAGIRRAYGLPEGIFTTRAAQTIRNRPGGAGTWFLPQAFSSGSPVHPAYGAGHATVAGACVTMLKAFFDEEQTMLDLIARAKHPRTGAPVRIVQPGVGTTNVDDGTGGLELARYLGGDAARMTVGGELNKLAANVAMGRSIGGVQWRSDNTRGLRLGEQISAFILAKVTVELRERPLCFSFTSFNGKPTRIEDGEVLQGGATIDPRATML